MACSFCRSTPVSPCPVCEVQHPLTPKAVRKAGKVPAGFQRVTAPPPAIRNAPPISARTVSARPSPRPAYQFSTDPEVIRLRNIALNDARIAELNAALRAAVAPSVVTPPATPRPVPIVVPAPTLEPRPVLVGWHAAAAFTLGILNRKRLPATIDGEVVPEKTTIARQGLKRGDWAGLARAVDAGWMTDAEAIEIAQGWRAVAS